MDFKKIISKIFLSLIVIFLMSSINAHASTGMTAASLLASTTPQANCYNGLCRTNAKLVWQSALVAGYSRSEYVYYSSPEEALINWGSFDYGVTDGFCQANGGAFAGIITFIPNYVAVNGAPYDFYVGNCGNRSGGSTVAYGACPSGYGIGWYGSPYPINFEGPSATGPSCYGKFNATLPTPYKTLGDPPEKGCSAYTKHPIHIGVGNKYLNETDYAANGQYSFNLSRSYNSLLYDDAGTGVGWQLNTYGYSINALSSTQVLVKRPDGKGYLYSLAGSVWQADADTTALLERLVDTGGNLTGWRFTIADGVVELYNPNGSINKITNRDGLNWSFTTVDTTTVVTDTIGRSMTFSVDTNGNRTVTIPDGGIYKYSTDSNNNLVSVTYPDSKVKTYLYENTSFPHALTGIIDENNSRYVTYAYDSSGRAYDEYLAPGLGLAANQRIDHNSLVYNVDGSGNPTSTVVTDALGSARTYNFTTILGVVKSTGQSQPAGSGCAASAAAMSYDANGNVATRTDFNGNKTSYVYDLTRNLETSRTEGLTTAGAATTATRTITTTWHPTWRLPLVITEYTGAAATGTALKKTTYVYDTKGNVTSFKQEDPVRSLSRTTTVTYTYSTAVPGLVLTKVVDGSRTDANDLTTYTYYPHDASCVASTSSSTATNLGCRGQLQSVKNALNQTTTYDRYNHHGQVEQMTDPNGMVITNSYDLRQRLLSSVVSGTGVTAQTTSLSYDNAGQITQLKMPDNSTLNYSYDPAHRLTQVQDTLSNKVVYTLDSEGNRTNENTYDPSGTLAKTITRSYDALNRLQTLTGQE